MIEMLFSIKFRSQLARTRPEVLSLIENNVINSIQLSGAGIRRENRTITAVFDERKIGFWLDVVFVIETIQGLLSANKRDLYGHTCIFSKEIDCYAAELLQKELSCVDNAQAVWCAQSISGEIKNFAVFKENIHRQVEDVDEPYVELDQLKNYAQTTQRYPFRKKIEKILLADVYRGTLLLGREYIGKADCLEWYCRAENGLCTPLVFRFLENAGALNCFVDALGGALAALLSEPSGSLPPRLAALHGQLFAERLRSEITPYFSGKAAEYLSLLLDAYFETAAARSLVPVVVLEDIQYARPQAVALFFAEWNQQAARKRRFVVLGSCSEGEGDECWRRIEEQWRQVFPGVISCTVENTPAFDYAAYNVSLWEIAYSCYLFGKFFPADCLLALFEQEGKNPEVLRKSLALLARNGIICSVENPRPAKAGFPEKIEALLGERTLYIRSVVVNRLLDWVRQGRLNPCFDLIVALRALGAEPSHLLILEAVKADIINGAFSAIEDAIAGERFVAVTGEAYAASLLYIYKTLKSLIYGSAEDIHQTFKLPAPDKIPNAEYRASILSIQAIYRMGINDTATALDQIKESMILYQNTKERSGISLVYRLFSLINLSRQEINDAIDYLNYAAEYNKKSRDYNEQALGYYYSSVVHFIYGNVSKAIRIIKFAIQSALQCGSAGWVYRAQFMLARYLFEIGEYLEAKKLFEGICAETKAAKIPAASQTARAWIERSALYLGAKKTGLKDLDCEDALLFRLEESYINKDYQETIELAGRIMREPARDNFIFLEQPCWTSGFSQCELLIFAQKDFWNRVVPVWRSLALSKLGGAGSEEAV
ncbi:MAG: hypothetical protein LBC72_00420, partial [Spirochaetaceae bacterium]|nr:hypothetical protein [Spirochaetaceae bacterium]